MYATTTMLEPTTAAVGAYLLSTGPQFVHKALLQPRRACLSLKIHTRRSRHVLQDVFIDEAFSALTDNLAMQWQWGIVVAYVLLWLAVIFRRRL